jgi:hypothetical protein
MATSYYPTQTISASIDPKAGLDKQLTYSDPAMQSLAETQLPPINPFYSPINTYAKEAAYMSSLPSPQEIQAKAIQAATGQSPSTEEKKRQVGYYRKKKDMKISTKLKLINKVAILNKDIKIEVAPINKSIGSLKNIKKLNGLNMKKLHKVIKKPIMGNRRIK